MIMAFIGIVSIVGMHAKTQRAELKKNWEFTTQPGIVRIVLMVDSSSPNVSMLDILYERGAHPSVSEEARFLREVLHELPDLGVDQQSLRAISMRGFAEPEVTKNLVIAALNSKEWYSSLKGGSGRVVEDLLNSLGAYNAFNDALAEYGLVLKVGGVEKVASARCSELKIADAPCRVHHNPQVPVGANITLSIYKK